MATPTLSSKVEHYLSLIHGFDSPEEFKAHMELADNPFILHDTFGNELRFIFLDLVPYGTIRLTDNLFTCCYT